MIYLLLSVICSVIVSILLKLARRYEVELLPAVAWNYVAATILTALIFRPSTAGIATPDAPWLIYAALAFLLPGIFVVAGNAVRYAGIVRTDVAQRLSLLISLTAAFLLFHETFSAQKWLGIAVGFAAIFCCIGWQKNDEAAPSPYSWLSLIGVFFGYGVIDVCFKKVAQFTAVPYFLSLLIIFIAAGSVAWLILCFSLVRRKSTLNWRSCAGGLLLGAFNFGNILFYLRGHQALPQNPALVFIAMNIGVIVLGSLVGIVLFREKLSKINFAGIALSLVAIFILFRDL